MYLSGTQEGKAIAENRIAEIHTGGRMGVVHRLPLKHPISNFFTTTPRAGSPMSDTLELLGPRSGRSNTMGYVRVKLF